MLRPRLVRVRRLHLSSSVALVPRPMSLNRVVVTGAAGFLGQHLVARSRTIGAATTSVVREANGARNDSVSIASVLADPASLEGTDVLVHTAAIRHRHGTSAAAYRASNVDLVETLVRACAGRVGRFVHVSSVGVYGFPKDLPITEATPFAPRTLYSQTKIEAEKLVARLAKSLGLDFTIVRPTIIYGPGDRNGMLDKLAAGLRARRYLVVGDGQNVLHHTHVDDVVSGIFTLAASDRARNEDFIVAGPETITLQRLSELVARTIGARVPPVRVPLAFARAVATVVDLAAYRGSALAAKEPPINNEKLDVMTVPIAFDPAKARAAGFVPKVRYEEGVARTLGDAGERSRSA
jgi:nucleoside-diphosphate-sugar epimerase